ncbi:M24 family metallopeptidase [Cereibacter sphaeroides]|uniref:M24 family metallopeptidase n=1 Tax=Cereibacter sphaeroides TaxID=1063 RepID=UPI000191CCF8|nr:Xaa-Pro peptidase family protein [Cereibacter sphaeroides]ACM03470.1 Creatinase [Cereibacter sphaeroides KD131]EKX58728.1 Xaa-Pro aminopeptidase [Rhodobacter sp. AKP1]RHZ99330.1 aminopeptidase P family protein [Cereibacter sphaeroides]
MSTLPADTAADPLRGRDAVFPAAEFEGRIARLQAATADLGADALVLLGPENIFWATGRQTAGYFAFQALVVPVEGAPVLLVRQLETTGARASTWLADIRAWQDGEDPAAALGSLVRSLGLGRIAMERGAWFIGQDLSERIAQALAGVALIDGSGVAERLRAVKSPAELSAIRKAAGYAEAAIAASIEACRAGVSENDVAAAMMGAAIRAGSEAMAMEPLVSSGPRSGVPHATWRRRLLEPGDGVFLELAASHDRYHAALMRSVWIGPPPAEAARMMDTAERALDAALAALRPGAPCAAPHEAAQAVIDAAGYTAAFRKRIGYSMGAAFAPDWGEGAILSLFTGVDRLLEPGMVFHLPATLRSYGDYTVGASETVILTETGIEVLSTLPRQMRVR